MATTAAGGSAHGKKDSEKKPIGSEGDEMTASRDLITKRKILDVIQRMPENGTIDDAMQRLSLLKAVAQGLKDVEAGRVQDHDQVFDELLGDDAQDSDGVERSGKIRSARTQAANSKGLAKKGARLRPKAKKADG